MERRLAAILCADVYGYSRLMGEDEEATLRTLSAYRKIIDSFIETHRGRFVNSAGDSVLAEFASVVEAVNCGVEIQTSLKAENADLPSQRRMEFRIGVNLGDVMAEDEQIYGDGVNIAARLESLAEPGGICISGKVYEEVRGKLAFDYFDIGEQAVKNIAEPVHVWRVVLDGTEGTRRLPRRYLRRSVFPLTGLAIAVCTVFLVQHLSLKPPHTSASIPPLQKAVLPLPSIPSIAVLPFTNDNGDPKQDYFGDGISDQLINNLSRLPGLFVIARRSSFAYKGKEIKENEIGKELGVKYLLEGNVRKAADQVRIEVELVDASTAAEVWTERFDRSFKDIFEIQDEIVDKVVTTLGLLLKLDERKLPKGLATGRPTDNVEAYDDLLRAFECLWRFTKEDTARGRQWAEKAIEKDPKYAQAYATLGALYWLDALNYWSENPAADLKRATELAQQALALDDSNGLALEQLCEIDWMQRRFDESVAEGQRTVSLNPSYAIGYQALTDALLTSDRPEEAINTIEKAIRLDPAGEAFYAYFIGAAYVQMGRYQEAIPFLKRNIAAYPHEPWAHLNLIVAYSELGREAEAQAEAAEVMRISPLFTLVPPEKGPSKNVALNERYNNDYRRAGRSDYRSLVPEMERKLTAILCADAYGYSRLMEADEQATVGTLNSYRQIIDSQIVEHHGRFFGSAGDSVIAEFSSVVEAVQCATDIQASLKVQNAALPPERRMEFRIGINLGDVIVQGDQLYGDRVNVAARLESLAEPGGICISHTVHDQIANKLALGFEDLGEQTVKNIVKPVRVFRVLPGGTASAQKTGVVRRYLRRGALSIAGVGIIVATIVLVQHLSLKPPHTSASIPPPQSQALALPDKPSIAVMPFINVSGDHQQEYFSDGITDDLITDLSRIPDLFVIARASSFTYKGKPTKLQEVGKELGVKYVLQGSVRKAAGEVRITVQLADASTGAELWAERYDRPLRDIFKLQDEIVHRIVTTSNLQLNLVQQKLGVLIPRSTQNLEAYDALLRGLQYFLADTRDGNTKARQMFEKAIALDPGYAVAYAALGENHWIALLMGFDSHPNTLDRALKLVQQAIALDDSRASAHAILAMIYLSMDQADSALAEGERGIALGPNDANNYLCLALVLNGLGSSAAALTAVEKAIRLDPRNTNSMYLSQQGQAYTGLGRWDEAISSLKAYQALRPAEPFTHVSLAEAYAGMGDQDAARAEVAELQRVVASKPDNAFGYVFLAQALNATGRPAEALAAAEKAIRLDPREREFYLLMQGEAYSQLGRRQEAVSILNRLLPSKSIWPHVWLAADYVELGRGDAARAEIAEVLKVDPQFSLKRGLATVPANQTLAADLHTAGLK